MLIASWRPRGAVLDRQPTDGEERMPVQLRAAKLGLRTTLGIPVGAFYVQIRPQEPPGKPQ